MVCKCEEMSISTTVVLSSLGGGLLVKSIELLSEAFSTLPLHAVVLSDGVRLVGHDVHLMLGVVLSSGSTDCASEEVLVLLFGEVNVIVPVGVRELHWVIPVILVVGVRAEVLTECPGLEAEIRDRTATVVVRYLHGSSVRLVVDCLGTGKPLLLLAKTFKDVIGADFHDGELLVLANLVLGTIGRVAGLELANLSVATAGDLLGHQGHELRVLHDW